jgi:hypothetical protein
MTGYDFGKPALRKLATCAYGTNWRARAREVRLVVGDDLHAREI